MGYTYANWIGHKRHQTRQFSFASIASLAGRHQRGLRQELCGLQHDWSPQSCRIYECTLYGARAVPPRVLPESLRFDMVTAW